MRWNNMIWIDSFNIGNGLLNPLWAGTTQMKAPDHHVNFFYPGLLLSISFRIDQSSKNRSARAPQASDDYDCKTLYRHLNPMSGTAD